MRQNCQKTGHSFSAPNKVGAGLLRTRCAVCGQVSIDLSAEFSVVRPLEWKRDGGLRARASKDLLVAGAASA